MKILERYSILLHIIGWIVFITVPLLSLPVSNVFSRPNFTVFVLPQIIVTLFLIIIFYLNLNFFTPNLLIKQNTTSFFLYLFAGFIILSLINMAIFEFYLKDALFKIGVVNSPQPPPPSPDDFRPSPNFGKNIPPPFGRNIPPPTFFSFRFFAIGISYILVIFASSILALINERIRSYDEKQQIILEKTAVELAVLKLQVSPHFLFNTLNNIRWLARQKSEKTEDAVVKLSQLLRYMLYQTSTDKVSLAQEIEHLNNYISLQKMRLTEKDLIEFICYGNTKSIYIEPLLFIPFVENAFKYGLHNQEKSLIKIGIAVSEGILHFYAENKVFGANISVENSDSGIGIQNVERRLALHYPEKHELLIQNIDSIFKVDLKIKLS
ncbi:sensor histidine kinase [Emticicia aquatica]|nr:sensor histidine kinase [Emticicia aquatica]